MFAKTKHKCAVSASGQHCLGIVAGTEIDKALMDVHLLNVDEGPWSTAPPVYETGCNFTKKTETFTQVKIRA
jgi:hypothetical protein